MKNPDIRLRYEAQVLLGKGNLSTQCAAHCKVHGLYPDAHGRRRADPANAPQKPLEFRDDGPACAEYGLTADQQRHRRLDGCHRRPESLYARASVPALYGTVPCNHSDRYCAVHHLRTLFPQAEPGVSLCDHASDCHRHCHTGTVGCQNLVHSAHHRRRAALYSLHGVCLPEKDDYLRTQQLQLDTDVLTGVYSRRAYSQALRDYDAAGPLPAGVAAFTVDINGLKDVNDSLGHEAGDELIRGAAECIGRSFDAGACCNRTGGDEFVVLTAADREKAENALRKLEQETKRWRGDSVKSLRVAAGYALAANHEGQSAEMLVKESDEAMYEAKAAYYRLSGKERRKRR